MAGPVELRRFREDVLAKYCGTTIVNAFYNSSSSSSSYGMLLTEEQMGKIVIQNVAEFMAFSLLSISIQVIFTLYFQAFRAAQRIEIIELYTGRQQSEIAEMTAFSCNF